MISERASWRNGNEEKWGEKSVISSLSDDLASLPRFTDQDKHAVQHCFHYTSTVLTSTLAFQKEQKLKCECQVSGLPRASLRNKATQLSAPVTYPQGKSPCLSGPWLGVYLVLWRPLKEEGDGFLRVAAGCRHCMRSPSSVQLGYYSNAGWLEAEVNAHLRL